MSESDTTRNPYPGPDPDLDLDRVAEDPGLTPAEKETTITWAKDQDRATITTEEASIMRRLIAHPQAVVTNTRERDGEIHAVFATVPVGCLVVSTRPRSAPGHADVVAYQKSP